MFCTSCGTKNLDSSAFCTKCGQAIATPAAEIKNTPKSKKETPATFVSSSSIASDTAKIDKAKVTAQKASDKALRPWYKKKRFWALGVIAIIVIANIANSGKNGNGNAGSNAATTSPNSAVSAGAALTSYFKTANNDLSLCVASIGTTQIELGYAVQSNATSEDYLNLYTAAKQAEGPCDIAQNNDLLNLGSMNPPPGYPSLANFSIDLQTWADSDCVTVLKDLEALANDPQSTADAGNYITDSGTADADAHLLLNQATRAARQAGIKNIGGNMILFWSSATN